VPPGTRQTVLLAFQATPTAKPPSFTTHVAKKGETLPRIAKRYGVSVTALASANSLSTKSKVSRGQEILIPQKVATVSKTKKTGTGKVTKAAAAPAPAPKSYKVKSGDTLYRIALHHGVTVAEILAINSLGGTPSLKAGDQLTIRQGQVVPGSC
jgi:LysM repeat protein